MINTFIMPYKVYKKGSGYKSCKRGGEKCFSKKTQSKAQAQAQMKALYANESLEDQLDKKENYKQNLLRHDEESQQDSLVYKTLYRVPKLNQFHVHYNLESNKNVIFNLIYNDGKTMEDVDYIETQVTDGDIPSIEFFEDPQSEEAKAILSRYHLEGDDIENAGQEGYEKIAKHYPQADVKESLEFENYFNSIIS